MAESKGLLKRSEVSAEYKWALEDLFVDEAAWKS